MSFLFLLLNPNRWIYAMSTFIRFFFYSVQDSVEESHLALVAQNAHFASIMLCLFDTVVMQRAFRYFFTVFFSVVTGRKIRLVCVSRIFRMQQVIIIDGNRRIFRFRSELSSRRCLSFSVWKFSSLWRWVVLCFVEFLASATRKTRKYVQFPNSVAHPQTIYQFSERSCVTNPS